MRGDASPRRSKSPQRTWKRKKRRKRISSGKRSRNAAQNRGRRGTPRRIPLTRTMATRETMTAMTPRGWQLALTESSRARCEATPTYRGRGLLRGHQAVLTMVSKGSPRCAALVPIPLLRPQRATGARLWRRGHRPAAAPPWRPQVRWKEVMGALAPALARREAWSRGPRLPRRNPGSRREVAQGWLVEGLAGTLFFPWGKIFTL